MASEGDSQKEGDRSVFLFEHFRDGMRAEDILISSGFHTHSGAPPPDVRTGCDLSVSVPTSEAVAAENKSEGARDQGLGHDLQVQRGPP